MQRRDFLHPRLLALAAGQLGALTRELGNDDHHEPADDRRALLRSSRRAMATTFEIALPFGLASAASLAADALDLVDELELQLTVYRDDSEVSRLNVQAALGAVHVEAGLFDLLVRARGLAQATEGAFDVATGALVKSWGFFRGPRRVPTAADRHAALSRSGIQQVVFDPALRTVRFLKPGVEINLGSIGKGYALDRAANFLRERNLAAGLLHGGQSSVYAIGTEPGVRAGWTVALRHPWQPKRTIALIRMRDRGLGTSAATHQHLEWQGRKLGHVLDPRTGWPAEELASASVLAPTAEEADALATAFFVLGFVKTRDYLAKHPGITAILLPNGDDARPLVLGHEPDSVSILDP